MKIAIIGYGKMGRLVEQLALQKGHVITSQHNRLPDEISENGLKAADICIDFSHPDCAMQNIQKIAFLKKNLVMGTTGWYDHLDDAKTIVKENNIGFLYSANFSVGVHLYMQILQEASHLMNSFQDYDVGGVEYHHNQKADAPSGTAKEIARTIMDKLKRKKKIKWNSPSTQLDPEELHFASLRNGSIPGTHIVMFDSPSDTITLTHQARNRDGFALGAISAAEWLEGKIGFYTLKDMM